MKILIGADKGGFRLKEAIALHLKEQGVEFEDLGTLDPEHPRDFTSSLTMKDWQMFSSFRITLFFSSTGKSTFLQIA